MTISWEEKLRKTEEIAQVMQLSLTEAGRLPFFLLYVRAAVPCVSVSAVRLCVVQERQKQLESLGISLQSSGIKVGDDKSFLVNLNADPALNELLVYYLKVRTLF